MISFSVYIIYSSSLDKNYGGFRADWGKWLIEQNSTIAGFTAIAAAWEFKWTEVYISREEALKRERQIKTKRAENFLMVDWRSNGLSE